MKKKKLLDIFSPVEKVILALLGAITVGGGVLVSKLYWDYTTAKINNFDHELTVGDEFEKRLTKRKTFISANMTDDVAEFAEYLVEQGMDGNLIIDAQASKHYKRDMKIAEKEANRKFRNLKEERAMTPLVGIFGSLVILLMEILGISAVEKISGRTKE